MLLQFSVENFLSFREAGVLSMLAADGVDHPPHMVMEGPEGKKVLRCAAVYGANASGKSNLVKALELATRVVLNGARPDRPLGHRPFKLDPSTREKPARFEWHLASESVRYSYGCELDDHKVHSEWLYETRGHTEIPVFERDASGIRPGPGLTSNADRAAFVRFVAEGTRSNQPFLAEARERNVHELERVHSLLSRCMVVQPSLPPSASIFDLLREEAPFQSFLSTLLEQAGTGIEDIRLEAQTPSDLTIGGGPSVSPHFVFQRIASGLWEAPPAPARQAESIVTYRVDPSGTRVRFNVFEESDGTQRLILLAPTLYEAERGDLGLFVAIDELERSLHPLLTRAFVERFLAAGGTSQLLFTTHDTNLLDLTLLSRDAIWFTEKPPPAPRRSTPSLNTGPIRSKPSAPSSKKATCRAASARFPSSGTRRGSAGARPPNEHRAAEAPRPDRQHPGRGHLLRGHRGHPRRRPVPPRPPAERPRARHRRTLAPGGRHPCPPADRAPPQTSTARTRVVIP